MPIFLPAITDDNRKTVHFGHLLVLLLAAFAVLVWAGAFQPPDFMSEPVYLAVHAACEIFAIAVALLIFAVGYHTLDRQRVGGGIILACAFLGVGMLDLLHTVSYPGMGDFLTPNTMHKTVVLWLGARLLAAAALLAFVLTPLLWPHRKPRRRTALCLCLTYTFILGFIGVFRPEWIPATYHPETGLTTFKVALEWLFIVLHLLTLALLWRYRHRFSPSIRVFLAPALLLLAASGLFFTIYQTISDGPILLGHLYKVAGYLLLYRAIFIENIHRPYNLLEKVQQQQRESEQALSKSHARLLEAQRIAHLGSWEWDITDNTLNWSDEVYRIFGVAPQEFGASYDAFLNYVHPEDRQAVQQAVNEALAGKQPYSIEHRLVLADGNERWVHEQAEVERDEAGQPMRMMGTVLDVTERKQMEERELQTDKMSAMGLMAGGIAHDFNNILTPIMMHTQLALRNAGDNPQLTNSLEQVRLAAERAANLVKQILDFSRQGQHEPMLVKLSMIVKEAVKFLQSVVPANINLQYRINTDRDSLAADPTQLLQVLMNLSLNAIHAMGDQEGVLTISLDEADGPPPRTPKATEGVADISGKNRTFSLNTTENGTCTLIPATSEDAASHPGALRRADQEQHWLKLTVQDTGSGIKPEHLPKLFDPFFTTKEKGQGTGMGLPVVHGIVSRHGGRIMVASTPGRGTNFEIFLPGLGGEVDVTPDSPVIPQGKGEHILLVDDEPAVLEAAVAGLTGIGYRLTTADDGIEALEMLRQQQGQNFDLLLTDYSMPKLKGTELAAAAKVIREDLPIILCTGYSSRIDEAAAVAMGISALIMKPLRQEVLATEIRRVLDNRQLHRGNGFHEQ
ncbi:MASE3 domain-containing protein [Desulfurivibrio dismutans]|uniref:MASE3 domain-containing protein n=1 Tax=Desulfurivibrio dismutans TaxID=1398908 RepID=UPI0023DCE93C|nr:MASE3 domain-containing protein [Desulfurivibrio alkaliphilus]MDF1615532.1 MASE3 domain-containing protein [Desulfurivibrio alkaliphilus]